MRAARLLLLLVVARLEAGCRPGAKVDGADADPEPIVVRHPPPPPARAFEEAAEAGGLGQERERALYVALPPTAVPTAVGSVFRVYACPKDYGFVDDDGGVYCGKVCGRSASGRCDDDDAGADCCGLHRCDRRATTQLPWQRPDGPMSEVCSRDERRRPSR